ncbi:hypothetical protein HQ545_03550 [Candidatus Woesearchaeota archaeon]|nr:hypothetical protein [Candidatus Woesearchaeota archaeon]
MPSKNNDTENNPFVGGVRRRKECPDCSGGNISFEPENERLVCQDCGALFEEIQNIKRKNEDEIEFL